MQLSASEQLVHATVRIECTDANGDSFTGTGYMVQFHRTGASYVPVIVTNKHVIAGAIQGSFCLTPADANGDPEYGSHFSVTIDDFEDSWFKHPDPDVDLAAMPVGPILNEVAAKGRKAFFRTVPKDLIATDADLEGLTAVEDIIMIGYPNGLWDNANNLPLVRRGITATHPAKRYEGRDEFVIDAACFPGSSGSPVFLYNTGGYLKKDGSLGLGTRIKLLGTLYAGPQHDAHGVVNVVPVPTSNVAVALSRIPNNLGFVIRASRIFDLEKLMPAPKPTTSTEGPVAANPA